jgi:hypothetical protein
VSPEAAAELAETLPRLKVRLVTGGVLGDALSLRGRRYLWRTFERLGVDVRECARFAVGPAGGPADDRRAGQRHRPGSAAVPVRQPVHQPRSPRPRHSGSVRRRSAFEQVLERGEAHAPECLHLGGGLGVDQLLVHQPHLRLRRTLGDEPTAIRVVPSPKSARNEKSAVVVRAVSCSGSQRRRSSSSVNASNSRSTGTATVLLALAA